MRESGEWRGNVVAEKEKIVQQLRSKQSRVEPRLAAAASDEFAVYRFVPFGFICLSPALGHRFPPRLLHSQFSHIFYGRMFFSQQPVESSERKMIEMEMICNS